jgi:hypothetical protein
MSSRRRIFWLTADSDHFSGRGEAAGLGHRHEGAEQIRFQIG